MNSEKVVIPRAGENPEPAKLLKKLGSRFHEE
jgi:hypothetical protein